MNEPEDPFAELPGIMTDAGSAARKGQAGEEIDSFAAAQREKHPACADLYVHSDGRDVRGEDLASMTSSAGRSFGELAERQIMPGRLPPPFRTHTKQQDDLLPSDQYRKKGGRSTP